MHNWAKSIMECVKAKVDSIGIANMDSTNLCELGKWTDIAKDIAEYDYYYNIVKAMEESGAEYGVDYDYRGKYYTPRMKRYDMTPEEYREHEPEYWRDMDRKTKGVMYYTESMPSNLEMDDILNMLEGDIKELKPKMSPNEMNVIRNKLNTLANMLM